MLELACSGLRYELRLPAKDAPVTDVMRALAAQYPRYGYRRIRIFLRRQGHALGRHRAHRPWWQAGLQLLRRRPRRRIATGRPRPLPAASANFRWAYDFAFDACANGQQIKCLTIFDEYTRECLAIDVAGSIRSHRVIEVLARLISKHGTPRYLRSDNGPEFVSRAILEWLQAQDIVTALIDPSTVAKRHRRIVQWQAARRMSERELVRNAWRRQDDDRGLAPRVQRESASHSSRRAVAWRIRQATEELERSRWDHNRRKLLLRASLETACAEPRSLPLDESRTWLRDA
jgi:hypothetical protein